MMKVAMQDDGHRFRCDESAKPVPGELDEIVRERAASVPLHPIHLVETASPATHFRHGSRLRCVAMQRLHQMRQYKRAFEGIVR
ncbi:MAG: hypothetical protein ACYCYO_19935 [Bacilli bacterium]